MKRKSPTKSGPREIGDLASAIRAKIGQVADPIKDPALDRLPVDLADVYEVCSGYMRIIDELLTLSEPWPKERVLALLGDIYAQLYVHLPFHYKRLPRGLETLAVALEPDEEKREALADQRLRTTLSKVKTLTEGLALQRASALSKRK